MKKCYLSFNKPHLSHHWTDLSLKLILTCAFALSCLSPAWSAASNKEQLKQLRQQIQTLQDNLNNTKDSKQKEMDALRKSEQAISQSNQILKKLARDMQTETVKLQTLQNQLSHARKNIEFEKTQLEQLLRQQYFSNQKDYLRLLFNQENPNQITRNLYYYRHLSQAHIVSATHLNNQIRRLEELQYTRQKKMESITTMQARYTAENNLLKQEKIKREAILSQISGQLTNQQKKITALKHDEKRLSSLVEQIGKLLVQKKASKKTSSYLYNDHLPSNKQKNGLFTSLKGHLRLPIRGKLFNLFGSPRSGKSLTWEGLFIQAPTGEDVKAIAHGQVVFANWLRGFGNLIIVDHGSNYMSLYGNNETLFKQVGDIIKAGDPIATVGNSGGNIDSGLYFELRHQGRPFNPLTWVKTD